MDCGAATVPALILDGDERIMPPPRRRKRNPRHRSRHGRWPLSWRGWDWRSSSVVGARNLPVTGSKITPRSSAAIVLSLMSGRLPDDARRPRASARAVVAVEIDASGFQVGRVHVGAVCPAPLFERGQRIVRQLLGRERARRCWRLGNFRLRLLWCDRRGCGPSLHGRGEGGAGQRLNSRAVRFKLLLTICDSCALPYSASSAAFILSKPYFMIRSSVSVLGVPAAVAATWITAIHPASGLRGLGVLRAFGCVMWRFRQMLPWRYAASRPSRDAA